MDKATANNYFSVSSAEYISNDVTSISFLTAVQKGLHVGKGRVEEGGGGRRRRDRGVKTNGKEWKKKLLLCIQIICL